jgi:hypothetical protein
VPKYDINNTKYVGLEVCAVGKSALCVVSETLLFNNEVNFLHTVITFHCPILVIFIQGDSNKSG